MSHSVTGNDEAITRATVGGGIGPEGSSPAQPRGRYAVFATVGLALLMTTLDQTSVATALTTLAEDMDADLAWAGWTITVYAVGQILALPLGGQLCGRFGRRRVFLAAVAIFTLLSGCCALTTGIAPLISCRFVQGLAGGVILPAASGIVAHYFPRDRDRALALFTSVFPIGAILGPLVGGIVLTLWSWRGIFLINIPIGVAIVGVAALLVADPPRERPGRVDVTGAALLLVLLLSAMAVVSMVGTATGVTGWTIVAAFAATAVGAGVLFGFRVARRRDAVIPARLLTGGGLGILNVTNIVFGAAVIGFSALLPLYAQIRYALPPLAAGVLLVGRAVGTIAFCWLAVLLLRRLGHRPLLIFGLMAVVCGLVVAAIGSPGIDIVWWLTAAAALTGVGVGVASPASSNAGMHLVSGDVAAAAGLRTMLRQIGGIVTISVTSAAVTASGDPGAALAVSFGVLAALVVVTTILAARVPNRRGRW